MASGICDTGRTRLSYADRRPACAKPLHYQSPGNVMCTPIGPIRDGQLLKGHLPEGHKRAKCCPVKRKPAAAPC